MEEFIQEYSGKKHDIKELLVKYYEVYAKRQRKYYDTELHEEWVKFSIGNRYSINKVLQVVTQKNDTVLLLNNCDYEEIVRLNERKIEWFDLKRTKNDFKIDLIKLAQKIEEVKPKVMIFANPFLGRVMQKEDLSNILEICCKYQVIVLVDESKHDFEIKTNNFISALSIKDGFYRDNMFVFDSPNSNLEGIMISQVIIPNPQLRDRYQKKMNLEFLESNKIGLIAGLKIYKELD